MWVLRLTVDANSTVVGTLAIKHHVILHLYPLLANKERTTTSVHFSALVMGKKSADFLDALRKLPAIQHITINGNHLVCKYKEKQGYDAFYNPEVFYLEPWIINGVTGQHHLSLASWHRDHLANVLNTLHLRHQSTIKKFTKSTHSSIFVFNVRPQLTTQQQHAIELAIQHGYYEYPRKIDVARLAKLASKSFSTFQAHLRKAERKIIPNSIGTTN